MKSVVRLVVTLISLMFVSLAPTSVSATYGVDQWRMRLYMLPPVDDLGNQACLTQRWHSSSSEYMRALDWKATCGASGTEIVRFRGLGVDVDNFGGGSNVVALKGVTQQLSNSACGIGQVRVASVSIWSTSGTLLGSMRYVHSVVHGSSSQFNINVRGTTLSGGYVTSFGFADTVSDASAGTSCWTGWHVHENNGGNDAFDAWNSKWDTASINTGYTNNSSANWIRRLTYVLVTGG